MAWTLAEIVIRFASSASDWEVVAAVASLLGLVIAAAAFLVAIEAWKSARDNLEVAEDALEISREQHSEFLKRLNAHAKYVVIPQLIHPTAPDDGVVTYKGDARLTVRWMIGVKNIGEKAGTHVKVNVILPLRVENPIWTTPEGKPIKSDYPSGPFLTPEVLLRSDGSDPQEFSHYLLKVIPRVGIKRNNVVMTVQGEIIMPDTNSPVVIPVKAKIWSDEMEDDLNSVAEVIETTFTRVE